MNRIPQPGDIIRISASNMKPKSLIVENVTSDRVELRDPFNHNRKLYLIVKDGNWIIPNSLIDYQIEILDKIPFTGIEQIDTNILL
jgi:hypothetical protein